MTRVLVVDDEELIRRLLVDFLEKRGYEALEAEDGTKALALAGRLKPQVILLDVAMPGLDGIETLKRLRQQVPESNVIMISGHADHETALRALDLGAHDFIEKPFDLGYLEKVVTTKIALSQ